MEKRIFLKAFTAVFTLLFFLQILPCFGQDAQNAERLKIHLWAELDAYPELAQAQDLSADIFAYSSGRIKEIAPFFINGMIYGWNFTYIPYDKTRGVEEFFEISEINTIKNASNAVTYKNPWVQDNLIHIWAEYERTPEQFWQQRQWKSITVKKAHGIGKGKISKGFDGLTDAAANAAKNAVREFYRQILKNKPKEINGRILITKEPLVGITEGQYAVQLDFFLETDRIVKYTMY